MTPAPISTTHAVTLPADTPRRPRVAVIGGGPAGLMAAEVLAQGGADVDLYDAMASCGRKFLLAGRGGLNLTHSEDLAGFLSRYAQAEPRLAPMVRDFGPQAMRDWAAGLGVETFVGSSGRVFPVDLKAAPLLRAWLHRLRGAGARFHSRHRWLGWRDDGALRIASPDEEIAIRPDATVLALGGASWPQLGSDGAWAPVLAARGIGVAPLVPSNCGFDVAPTAAGRAGWSDHLRERHAGQPVKPVVAWVVDPQGQVVRRQQGEFVLTATGIEGSLVYAFSALLRDAIATSGAATLWLDLLPSHTADQVLAGAAGERGSRSLANHLKCRLGLQGLKMALLHELLSPPQLRDPQQLARSIKALPIRLAAPRPVTEAISSAGGVRWVAVDERLMLRALPGTFCAGEMLDWEAPTGGYLLTACVATGHAAGLGLLDWWAGRN